MQISPPIIKKPELPNLRVAVLVRSWRSAADDAPSRVQRTRKLLSMVCREPVKVVVVSDASLPLFDRGGLAGSVRAVETGEVDLAIAESCYEISCSGEIIRDVVKRCNEHGVRFIAFHDQIDTADPDFPALLDQYLADENEDEE